MATARRTMTLVRVTPKMAREWLKKNKKNRHYSAMRAKRYATEMTAGRWKVNGESIKFDADKNLCDGQHRLEGIMIADIAVEMYVMHGLDLKAYDTLDVGKPRNVSDVFSRAGKKHYALLAATLRWVHAHESGMTDSGTRSSGTPLLTTIAIDVLARHPGIEESCEFISKLGRFARGAIPTSQASYIHYYGSLANRDKANDFWTKVLVGENLLQTMPEYALRSRLDMASKVNGQSLQPRAKNALAIKAWNASLAGKRMRRLQWTKDEDYPEFATEVK